MQANCQNVFQFANYGASVLQSEGQVLASLIGRHHCISHILQQPNPRPSASLTVLSMLCCAVFAVCVAVCVLYLMCCAVLTVLCALGAFCTVLCVLCFVRCALWHVLCMLCFLHSACLLNAALSEAV